ncbi:unnamed protein product [Linum trigynum]|uniref:CCHC-type domain-containing protein n=1 Tax=Linum trigynum TaxID=586398 RepID=A0AAV2D6H2_9ROSI
MEQGTPHCNKDGQSATPTDDLTETQTREAIERSIQSQIEMIKLADDDALVVEDEDIDTAMVQAMSLLGLVGRVVSSKKPNLKSMKIALSKAWNLQQNFQISEVGDYLIGFQFMNKGDRDRVLLGGPWHFDNSLIIFKQADAFQQPRPEDFYTMEIWIQIYNLPAAPRTKEMIQKIGARFGTMIWTDSRRENAWNDILRIRVGIDIRIPLKHELKLNLKGKIHTYEVKYERLPMFCFSCGLVGHPKLNCPNPSSDGKDRVGPELRVNAAKIKPWQSKLEREESGELWQALRAKFDREAITDRMMVQETEQRRNMKDDSIDAIQRRLLLRKAEEEIEKEQQKRQSNYDQEKNGRTGVVEEPGQTIQEKKQTELTSSERSSISTEGRATPTEIHVVKTLSGAENLTFSPGYIPTQETQGKKVSQWKRQNKGDMALKQQLPVMQLTPQKRGPTGDDTITEDSPSKKQKLEFYNNLLDGEVADPAKQQGRPAQ